MRDEFLFVEKYRPKRVDDTILPEELKTLFKNMLAQGDLPNLIFSGGPGIGKTTVAKALLEELGADYLFIPASMKGNIDTLRNEIQSFASSVSFTGMRKFVILDESDFLNPQSTQPALRSFMEEYSNNCGFILTCNFKNKLIEPLKSRCTVVDFKISKKEATNLASQFFKRLCWILGEENIEYDKSTVAELVKKHFPDFRRTLNEIQRYSVSGKIDSGILSSSTDGDIGPLLEMLKKKEFTNVRKWVGENTDIDASILFRLLYDKLEDKITIESLAHVILILADYQYKSAFAVDQEINTMAALLEIMSQAAWK